MQSNTISTKNHITLVTFSPHDTRNKRKHYPSPSSDVQTIRLQVNGKIIDSTDECSGRKCYL